MKPGAVLAAIAAMAGIGISIFAFVAGATPYVTVEEAKADPGRSVHIAGEILHDTARLDIKTGLFVFDIKDDDGSLLTVEYPKGKPGNFDSAPKASVLGAYEGGRFIATQIKTQCPSKYESTPKS